MAESKSVVLAALFANGVIAVLKFVGFLLTGSAAMLSETYHSVSDTGNQLFLLLGIRYSNKEPSREHPFGYGKAQFFYSFLVSVLLFGIAGWESVSQSYHALTAGESSAAESMIHVFGVSFPGVWVNYAVLIGVIVFEGYSFMKAHHELTNQMDDHGWDGFVEAFKKTSDVTTLTAFTEDSVAVAGGVIALVGVVASEVTGNSVYDASAGLVIGVLLMGFAVALAWENKRLLLGESLPADEERRLYDMVAKSDEVEGISDFRTVYFGPERVIVTADVDFEDHLDAERIDEVIGTIESALVDANLGVRNVYIEPDEPDGPEAPA